MQVHDGAAATIASELATDSGVEEDYDQENHAHHVIQPQTDTDEASTDTDEGYVPSIEMASISSQSHSYADSDATSFMSSILSEVRRYVHSQTCQQRPLT